MEILESSVKTTAVVDRIAITKEEFEKASAAATEATLSSFTKSQEGKGKDLDPVLTMTVMLVSVLAISELKKELFKA
jgi:hypothetical protein